MGVSESGDGGGIGVDCSVGTIVWVRRRNGSWWPGRILGPEELSASHLMSPRSGTPVKLLGREDASVDWYNLEKSKRVKAFRCGEFDACIEKAEASLGVPIKKREKYARREDAILHALELERKQLELEQKHDIITNGTTSKSLGAAKREFSNISSSDTLARNDEPSLHYDYAICKSPLPREAGLLHEGQNIIDSMNINDGKECKRIGGDKDNSEGIPRMRGLQDFGLRIASKKKLSQPASWLTTRKPAENNNALVRSGNIVAGMGRISNGKSYLATKQKRSDGSILEESLVKKRDRRRPLLQVLQTSAKLEAPHSSQLDQYPHLASMQGEKDHTVVRAKRSRSIYLSAESVNLQGNTGYSSEETQTLEGQFGMDSCRTQPGSLAEDCSFSGMSETNESDSYTRDYLETEMEGDLSDDTGRSFASKPKDCSTAPRHISEEFGFTGNDEVPYSTNIPHPFEHAADASTGAGASNWHMKGKRNIRNIVKMPVDMMDDKICVTASDKYVGFDRETADVARCSSIPVEEMEPPGLRAEDQGFYHIKEGYNASDEVDLIGEDFLQEQVNGYNSQRYKDLGRSHLVFNNFENDSHLMLTSGWETDGLPHVARRKYWEESDEFNDPGFAAHASREMASILFDVDLKVKASYQGEHVPLVSLMSRLNGKAIIGHPIQIEILEDGSTGQYFSSIYACPDENTVHQPVWRTARRTVMQRVPRSNLLASTFEDDEAEGSRYSELQNKYSLNLYSDHSKNQSWIAKHKVFHAHQPLSGKFQKKSLKRISLSNQKTRTLSSFATEKRHGQNGNPVFARGRGILSGLIKQEEQVPSVTCVPVKVAFSRILEAVGRPSSTVSHHVRRMTNPATKDPL